MFAFQWPWMIFLLALPLLARAWLPAAEKNTARETEIAFPYIERLKAAFSHESGDRKTHRFYYIMLILLWACLTCVLMRPQLVDRHTQIKNKGYDLMLAVDLSGSMRALDFATEDNRVNRLDVIKSVVNQFVKDRQGDRIGLVLFGAKAYLHVPLTLDTESVRKMLDNAQVGEAGDSTAIGDAIGLAVRNLRDRPESSRVIVLLTDGGDNASTIPPLEAAKLAKQYGIRVFTIGIGLQGPVPIPDETGRIVMADMPLDPVLLQKIADITGGSFFRATDTEALKNVYAQINKLAKTESQEKSYVIREPLYRYPLGLAAFLLLMLPLYGRMRHGF